MAFFFKNTTQRRAEDFKNFLCELVSIKKIKQDAIAYSLGVSQPCIAQWMDPNGDRHLPAALIPELPKEMAVDVLKYLGRQLDVRANFDLNGRIDDEIMNLDERTGEFIRLYRNGPKNKAAIIAVANEMMAIIEHAIAEVESL